LSCFKLLKLNLVLLLLRLEIANIWLGFPRSIIGLSNEITYCLNLDVMLYAEGIDFQVQFATIGCSFGGLIGMCP